ncbi:hypothetical protein FRC08_001826, partial [Ceratobasidium sp. 394]
MSQLLPPPARPAPSPIQGVPQGPVSPGMSTFSAETLRGNPSETYEKLRIESSRDAEATSPVLKADTATGIESSDAA